MDTSFAPLPLPETAENGRKWTTLLKGGLSILLIGGAGAIVGYLIGRFAFTDDSGFELTLWHNGVLILSVIVAFFIVITVHELGHVIAGKLSGMQLFLLIVGPLQIKRQGERLEWSLNRSITLAGGLAGMVPTDTRQLRKQLLWMVAGGPLGSLLLAVSIFAGLAVFDLFMLSPERHTIGTYLGQRFLLFTGVISSVIFLTTLIPNQSAGFLSDGRRLLRLWRGGAVGEQEAATVALMALSMKGERPRDWDPALIERVVVETGDAFASTGQILAYTHELDRGDVAAAHRYLTAVLSHWPRLAKMVQSWLAVEAAYFEAWHRHDVSAAQTWLEQVVDGPFLEKASRLRAEAAVSWRQGNRETAVQQINEALSLVDSLTDKGSAQAERAWLEGMREEMGRKL